MNFEDFIIPPKQIKHEKWQFGSLLKSDIPEKGIALLWMSDQRGSGGGAEIQDFIGVRRQLYRLSKLDFEVPVCDLGDLVSGKTPQDSHYIIQEVLSACHYKKTIPIIIGGSCDFSYSLFSALNFHEKDLNYTHISNTISLSAEGEEISEKNFLSKIFSTKNFSIKNFHLLGYQKHLNEEDSVKIIKQVEFDVVRLAEMMDTTHNIEPFFRNADLVTFNCNAVESFSEPFSVHPQVNGLNRREICAYMKEAGLSENLKSVGIFNYDSESDSILNQQLLAQMLWYLIEGINIRDSHPKEKNLETFWVLIDDREFAFRRDTFTDLWYFGEDEDLQNCLPCSREEYDQARKGSLPLRLAKFIS